MKKSGLVWSGHEIMIYIGTNAQNLYIYIGINVHVTPAHGRTDGNVKVEQYSAEAESAILNKTLQNKCTSVGQKFLRYIKIKTAKKNSWEKAGETKRTGGKKDF